MKDEIKEIKVNKANKSITFINNGIAFSQFGVADEILDLITNLQEEKIQLEGKIKQLEHNCKQASDSCRQHRLASKNHIRRLERREQQINIYKSRNEKAIEFLEHFDSGQQCEHTKDLAIIVENILQGEDKDE